MHLLILPPRKQVVTGDGRNSKLRRLMDEHLESKLKVASCNIKVDICDLMKDK
jgi:hypothetical protein